MEENDKAPVTAIMFVVFLLSVLIAVVFFELLEVMSDNQGNIEETVAKRENTTVSGKVRGSCVSYQIEDAEGNFFWIDCASDTTHARQGLSVGDPVKIERSDDGHLYIEPEPRTTAYDTPNPPGDPHHFAPPPEAEAEEVRRDEQ